jgi:hypothetical protein
MAKTCNLLLEILHVFSIIFTSPRNPKVSSVRLVIRVGGADSETSETRITETSRSLRRKEGRRASAENVSRTIVELTVSDQNRETSNCQSDNGIPHRSTYSQKKNRTVNFFQFLRFWLNKLVTCCL